MHDVLVEKFIPEMRDGFYCLRVYHFLGQKGVCVFRQSTHPIINAETAVKREVVDVHPEIPSLAKSMGFDYGKFDYVMQEGQPVLLDANKTPGAGHLPIFFDLCREWAKGIHAYMQ